MIQAETITIGSGRTVPVVGRVLDDLGEPSAIDHSPGGHGHVLAGDE